MLEIFIQRDLQDKHITLNHKMLQNWFIIVLSFTTGPICMQMLEISGMELDSQIYRSAIRGHVNVVCLLSD